VAPISALTNESRAAAIATVVDAFADDPVERWLWPERKSYEETFPKFVAAFGGRALEQGSAWGLDGGGAVAMWLPPNVSADEEELVAILRDSISPEQLEDTFAVLEQMSAAHPSYVHWYLPWLAVDPARQGEGLGSTLLAHGLRIVDAEHLPAFLETPNPRTVPLYERHGFEVVATAQAGSCPPITSMLRAAVRGSTP
jgi:ribosomal protein S18 acetylase RimI-like enzyme